jgi:hypothetical protein
MKKLFSVLVILCWLAQPAWSQGQKRNMAGQLEVMKTGFITTRLQLTSQEAQKFWPIYNAYSTEVRQVIFNFRHQPNSSEIVLEEQLLNIKKKYSVEFLKAIPPPKINEFFKAEKDFNTFVRNEMLRRQMQRGRPYPASPQPLPPQGP